ncbi:PREDICTED: BTB/POZ and TAZ domain-containing protein 1-like [Tarenaya hassleriana]|uniref:BTB/POZ and TAZ domain-containing protein 1-like n=1 Tax=Tarenaya hassleriana TaxID=28532 RepID=UPI00053C8A99|nr:PREDICTED: BTB/POZ and TAZ domain-containing protein 1-like [Tarenaya hassleriana]
MAAVLITTAIAASAPDTTGKIPRDLADPDVEIVTSGRRRIPAHSGILVSASPVLKNIIERRTKRHGGGRRVIRVLGVPCGAVSVFVEFLYNSSLTEEEMEKYGIHLLALSHVYMVAPLKQRCTKGVGHCLTAANVVDVLQLARLCDAPDLCLRCMRLIYAHFKTVEQTEGWKFLQEHDPFLELDILQFIEETESRKKRRRRHRREQSVYMQLSEAMDCLEHICTEGCTLVGPNNVEPGTKSRPCRAFSTCHGLQLLIRHFAVCKRRAKGQGCLRCKRMLQLLRLHSSICDQHEHCRVPLCRQFRKRAEEEEKMEEDTKWNLLVRRVVSAKVMSSLSHHKEQKGDTHEGQS